MSEADRLRGMRPLILGEAPSRSGDTHWRYPMSGEVGKRLCIAAQIPADPSRASEYGQYYWPLRARFELRNVIERWPGPRGRGADFPWELAKDGLNQLRVREILVPDRVVICLGRRVQSLFCKGPNPPDFYVWIRRQADGIQLVTIPHPSGLNHLWNDPEHIAAVGKVLRAAVKRTKKLEES